MFRLRRRSQRRQFAFELFNFGPRFFNTADPNNPTAGGGSGAAQPPNNLQQGNADLIPRSEAKAAFLARDAAKAEARAIASAFGLDPDAVKVVKTDDPEKPFKLEGDGVAEALEVLSNARQNKRQSTKWEDRERELTTKFTKQLQDAAQRHTRERSELENLLRTELTIPALRAAFAQEGAIDHEGKGNFGDLIRLTQDRVKVDIASDDAGKFRVTVTPLREDGTPLLDDKTGQPVGMRQLAAAFLNERPHLRNANFRRGPGVGGRGTGAAAGGGQQQQPLTGGEAAAAYIFGPPRT